MRGLHVLEMEQIHIPVPKELILGKEQLPVLIVLRELLLLVPTLPALLRVLHVVRVKYLPRGPLVLRAERAKWPTLLTLSVTPVPTVLMLMIPTPNVYPVLPIRFV